MHDGPAQSLTNIVLQAEIAHRLMARDRRQRRPKCVSW
jgi:signal transduction histidine kinase